MVKNSGSDDRTGIVQTELFASTYRTYGLGTVRYLMLEVVATVEPFANRRGFSLRVLRAGRRRQQPDAPSPKVGLPLMQESSCDHPQGCRSAILVCFRPTARRAVREELFFRKAPARPGVYLMCDATGEVVYVGKAKLPVRPAKS